MSDSRAGVEDLDRCITHEQLTADLFGLRRLVPPGGVAVIRSPTAILVGAALQALEGWAADVCLAGDLPVSDLPEDAIELGGATTRTPGEAATPLSTMVAHPSHAVTTRWWLYSSGTTGEPKAVAHTRSSLSRTVRTGRAGAPARRWGMLYEPTRMAGAQVLIQALTAGDHLLDAMGLPHLGERVAWLAEHGVDSLSATPTTWRQILQTPASRTLRVRQITLGGEIADQRILDALHRSFPEARITHVFASTETGAAFGVSDGREGFPARYLDDPPGGVLLEVRDGILHVAAQTSATEADGFVSTGDVVEVLDDRVLFRGRASGLVNIGGVKVWPEQVEKILRCHPDVADALVTSRRNAFSGWILTALVVPVLGADRATLPVSARELCAASLPAAAVPATVKVVDELPLSSTGKAVRQ